jgi:hypothetical protein
MANDNPTFQIPKDVIEPIIQAQISAAVLAALQPTGRVLEQAVSAVMQTKVDSEGKPERYSGHGKPWIDWVVADCIQKSARSAIEQFLTEQQKVIRASIAKQLTARNSPLAKQLIEGMLAGLISESTLRYRIHVTADKND